VTELRRMADLLGIEPERFGIAEAPNAPRTPEQIDEIVEHVWRVVEDSRVREANAIIMRLIDGVRDQITTDDKAYLRSLAHAYHAAGYVTAVGTRSFEAHKSIPYYHEVEELGRLIEDPTLINIGLTYQGDMHQRMGQVDKALVYLEAARDTTEADVAALGNGIQLLGRAYLRVEDLDGFERAMAQSEEMTALFDPAKSSTKGHYSLGTVLEEYGRGYATLGKMNKALPYLERAEQEVPNTEFWQLLIITARAIALVKGGELRAGTELATLAAERCRTTGNIRFLDRIYIIQHYLDELTRDIAMMSAPLREALHGGVVADY
jgi:tetratricopeptide (TPR) repeat protein